jgi:hypothetical protein
MLPTQLKSCGRCVAMGRAPGAGSTAQNVLLVLEALEQALKQQGFRAAGDARGAAEKVLAATV